MPGNDGEIVVNQLVFADLLGVDRSTIQALIRRGLPVVGQRAGRGRSHQIPVGPGFRWIRQMDQAAHEEQLVKGNPAHEEARLRKLQAEARIAEANAAEREAELVPAAQVGERWARMALEVKERALVLPAVAVQKGVIAGDQEAALVDLVHDVLRDLASRNGHGA
jgi:phage terminase Nu1 subunit (DNA packaging protein)